MGHDPVLECYSAGQDRASTGAPLEQEGTGEARAGEREA